MAVLCCVGTAGVFGLSVTTIGDKTTTNGSTLAPIFVRHRMRNRDGRLDTIQTIGTHKNQPVGHCVHRYIDSLGGLMLPSGGVSSCMVVRQSG